MWKEWSHGHVGTGSSPRALMYLVSKSKCWPVMLFNSMKRKERLPGKQETQPFVPVPHSRVMTRHKPFETCFPVHSMGTIKPPGVFWWATGNSKK